MNRLTLAVVVGVGVALAGWLSLHERERVPTAPATATDAAGGAGGGSAAPGGGKAAAEPKSDTGGKGEGGGTSNGEVAPFASAAASVELAVDMPSPEALSDAPKSVRFGIVLVNYAGAQGAPKKARSKKDARALAQDLATLAADDFAAAVSKGDPGSSKNAGRMYRGILEPGLEYELFKLDKGQVSQPIDTPRGFWVVKRRK